MLPLKVALLWHFHQPYYRKESELILPWVRLHGIKDYFDLPELFHEFPDMKQTINVVPSMMIQIGEYISGGAIDNVQRLSSIRADELTKEDKLEILKQFFLCNVETMVFPYHRYKELYDMALKPEMAIAAYSDQDWLDLQVWYNLTWFGRFSRERSPIKRLLKKGSQFTEQEKKMLLQLQLDILTQIIPQFKNLKNLGQLELSCTPMYHPILPLLCDSRSALEAMPDVKMPRELFKYPEDAKAQIENSLEYMKDIFGAKPDGMWPSEGSISDEALELMARAGVKWVASDEEILSASKGDAYSSTDKYFPQKFRTKSGDISILFRDHHLSDAIGFVYSRWKPYDAAGNFCQSLRDIKKELVDKYGESCLEHAVVPVILDGENCWEYYQDDGVNFRRELSRQLLESDEFETVTCADAADAAHTEFLPSLRHIRAGSWINANFKIWIGHKEDRAAWTMLAKARTAVEEEKNSLSVKEYRDALEQIYIAEGSDWFWWYGDEHPSKNKAQFDELFRFYIRRAYEILNKEIPDNVSIPISDQTIAPELVPPSGMIYPDVNGKVDSEQEWNHAGYFDAAAAMSAMHQIGEILLRFWYGEDEENLYFRCDTSRKLKPGEYIEIQFLAPKNFTFIAEQKACELKSYKPMALSSFSFANDDTFEFGISKQTIFGSNIEPGTQKRLELLILTKSDDGEIFYPRQGSLELVL